MGLNETVTIKTFNPLKNGTMSSKFKPDKAAVEKILNSPYFIKPPPKSTGRDDFPIQNLLEVTSERGPKLVSTATEITAASIANAYQNLIKQSKIDSIYFCGGGAKNQELLRRIKSKITLFSPSCLVKTLEEVGFDSQKTEAEAFAYLGFLSLIGHELGGSWTGGRSLAPSGMITPGQNWNEILDAIAP